MKNISEAWFEHYLLCPCLMGKWKVTVWIYATPYHLFFVIKSNIGAETQGLIHEDACVARQHNGV